jgi:glucose-6-phosphate isomerase
MDTRKLWERYKYFLHGNEALGMSIDISRMNFPDDFFPRMEGPIQEAFRAMAELEAGAVANPDEQRMVGHYWLRAPALAPTPELGRQIYDTVATVRDFARGVHAGAITPPEGGRFTNLLIIGIGGSALGPQFVADALGTHQDKLKLHFFDNTDPDGMDRVIMQIGPKNLGSTLTLVISKSGGTKETRNGMLEVREAYRKVAVDFPSHAVAVTGEGSELDRIAVKEGWLARFPMWDWVGGRTSVTSAVGLLPAALQGIDIDAFLEGARLCDEITRSTTVRENPAALLALMWFHATGGAGRKDMVLLPYKDRLLLFSRYLQQLIMESIGKEFDRDGNLVNQGLSVYGNKGSTDQHAYVQQLREGVDNFFVTFIDVLRNRSGKSLLVEPDATSGDYLFGFFLGTRAALYEKGRESITITVEQIDPRTVGALVALYERAVGFYASLVNINAYHQPGVEAGKKAAESILSLQREILAYLRTKRKGMLTATDIATALDKSDQVENIYLILEHLQANPDHGVIMMDSDSTFTRSYQLIR